MEQFYVSVFSDAIASLMVGFLLWATRHFWLSGFYSDIARVYTSRKRGRKAINKDIAKSDSVRILSIRGKSLVESSEYPSLWEDQKQQKKIEVIVSSLKNDLAIAERSQANNTSKEEYIAQMQYAQNIFTLKTKIFPNLTVLNHMENPPFRLVVLDHCLYVSYYLKENNVNKSRLVKYKSENGAYNAFLQYYENILKHSDKTPQVEEPANDK